MSTVTLEDGVAKQAALRVSKDLAGIDIAARVTAAHLDELAGHHPATPSKDLPSSSRRATRTTADRPAGSAGWVAPDQTLPGASRRGTRTTSDRPAGSRRGTRASADQLMPFDGAAPDRLVAAARLPLVEEDVHQLERVAAFAAGERQPAPVVVSAASRSTASVPVAPALGQAEVLQEGAGSAAGRLPADAPAAWLTAQAQQQLLAAQLEAMSQLHAGGVPASAVQLVAVAQQQQQLTAQLEARGQLTAGTLQQVDVQQAAAGVASFPVRQQTSEASRETEDEDSSSGSESGSETESSSGSDRSEKQNAYDHMQRTMRFEETPVAPKSAVPLTAKNLAYAQLAAGSDSRLQRAPSKLSMASGVESSAGSAVSAASGLSNVVGGRKRTQQLTETYNRARARLQALQENEAELFTKKSVWRTLKINLKEGARRVSDTFSLWRSGIQSVEGKHGSNVSLTLYFVRFALLMNFIILAIWVCLTVFPFFDSPPSTFSWSIFRQEPAKDMLQGYGLDNTFLLYGGYNYPVGSKHGFFRPDLMWTITIGAMYLVSLLMLLYNIQKRLKGEGDSSFVGSNRFFPFSTVVFASWDFHLTDPSAARNLRRSIRNQLKEMVNDALLADKIIDRKTKIMNFARKAACILILWPIIVAGTAASTYYIVVYSSEISQQLSTSYGPTICLSAVNIISGQLVYGSTLLENWDPRYKTDVEAFKYFWIKAINVGTLVFQLYRVERDAQSAAAVFHSAQAADLHACNMTLGVAKADAECPTGLVCCDENCDNALNSTALYDKCVPGCPENVVGITFYRYILTNVVSMCGVNIFTAISYKLVGWLKTYDAPSVVIQTIENNALVWLGSMFSPLLPALGLMANCVTFYTMWFLAVWLYDPPTTRYSASRTSNMAYGLMLLTLIMVTVPLVFNLGWKRERCGPHQGTSMQAALVNAVANGPKLFAVVLQWIVNPIVLGSIIIFLAFWLLILQARHRRYSQEASKLKLEFEKYRQEMQTKVVMTRRQARSSMVGNLGARGTGSSDGSIISAVPGNDWRVSSSIPDGPYQPTRRVSHTGVILQDTSEKGPALRSAEKPAPGKSVLKRPGDAAPGSHAALLPPGIQRAQAAGANRINFEGTAVPPLGLQGCWEAEQLQSPPASPRQLPAAYP
eukprot:jgi/Astpho2/729/fgenesh1_pg.00015_%23_12_t